MPDSVTFGKGASENASLHSYITAVGRGPAVTPCLTHSGHCSRFVIYKVFDGFLHPAFEVALIFSMFGPKSQPTSKFTVEADGVDSGEENTRNSCLMFDGFVVLPDF